MFYLGLDCLPREAVAFPTTYTDLAFHFSFRDFFQTVKHEIRCELQIPRWRLDCCLWLFIPSFPLAPFQSVLQATARVIFSRCKSDHVTPHLSPSMNPYCSWNQDKISLTWTSSSHVAAPMFHIPIGALGWQGL